MDVPRAGVCVVENAEMFGLSQLHQLRGRLGRTDRGKNGPETPPLTPSATLEVAKRAYLGGSVPQDTQILTRNQIPSFYHRNNVGFCRDLKNPRKNKKNVALQC